MFLAMLSFHEDAMRKFPLLLSSPSLTPVNEMTNNMARFGLIDLKPAPRLGIEVPALSTGEDSDGNYSYPKGSSLAAQ